MFYNCLILEIQRTTNDKKMPSFPTIIITFKTKIMWNIKRPTCLGIIGSFLVIQLLKKIYKWEEEISFFCIIISWLIQNLVKVFVPFVGFYVHVQPVFLNLINISIQIFIHHINQFMPVLKIVTIKKYLGITTIGSSCNS